MKPFRVLLYFLSIYASIVLLSLAINGGFEILGFKFSFPTIDEIAEAISGDYYKELEQKLDEVSSKVDKIDENKEYQVDTTLIDTTKIIQLAKESTEDEKRRLLEQRNQLINDSIAKLIETYKKENIANNFIIHPDSTESSLNAFHQALSQVSATGSLIRILHYGDSQIEGDRITKIVREKLQKTFGGSGPGLVAAYVENNYNNSIIHSYSGNWKSLYARKGHSSDGKYGAMGFFSRSSNKTGEDIYSAWVKLEKSSYACSKFQLYDKLKIYYSKNNKTTTCEVTKDKKLLKMVTLQPTKNLETTEINGINNANEIKINFFGSSLPDIYGITLDGQSGVAVDNIAIRGSSGLEFGRSDIAFMSKMYKEMNVKLVIFQFGVNLVPSMYSGFDSYEDRLYRQLTAIKKANPDLCIIIASVTDMAKMQNNSIVSYSNIEPIYNAQKNAAKRAGVAFWDLYKAMGGKNSMQAWVELDLARYDYTHFNNAGANKIGIMLLDALMLDYKKYRIRKTFGE